MQEKIARVQAKQQKPTAKERFLEENATYAYDCGANCDMTD